MSTRAGTVKRKASSQSEVAPRSAPVSDCVRVFRKKTTLGDEGEGWPGLPASCPPTMLSRRAAELRRREPKPPRLPDGRNATARLTEDQVREIRRRAETGEPREALATAFGIVPAHVRRIVRRDAWRAVD